MALISPPEAHLRPPSAGKIGISSDAVGGVLRRDSIVSGREGRTSRRTDEPEHGAEPDLGSHQGITPAGGGAPASGRGAPFSPHRSEERRVGKEGRSRWPP